MALATDLMGLSFPPLLSQYMAVAGTGPIANTATGTNITGAFSIGATQYMTFWTTGASSSAVLLPAVGGTGCPVGSVFFLSANNASGVNVNTRTGCTLNLAGFQYTSGNQYTILQYKSAILWCTSSTQWVGVVV